MPSSSGGTTKNGRIDPNNAPVTTLVNIVLTWIPVKVSRTSTTIGRIASMIQSRFGIECAEKRCVTAIARTERKKLPYIEEQRIQTPSFCPNKWNDRASVW